MARTSLCKPLTESVILPKNKLFNEKYIIASRCQLTFTNKLKLLTIH